ncbi:dihydrofolate reductase family protein [Geodermatophilus sp. FMUSA9-8]|uniref:dihydrofolate reductase family protein n=1 Tax=Geodermatophilus sp. FMUSA9-8 TaxID=3120155 RepID=UPI003008120F
MELTTTTFVSVDGVMQGIGAPDEDRRGGLERGGWTTPLFDAETGAYLTGSYQGADAFLFGRRTFEIFAASWGAVADPGINEVARSLHERPKYVASATLTATTWTNTTVLAGDLVAAVTELKARPGSQVLVPGSGALIRWLLAHDLVDRWTSSSSPSSSARACACSPTAAPPGCSNSSDLM